MTNNLIEARPWHTLSGAEACRSLGTSAVDGLTADEAARRFTALGPNELGTHERVSPWKLFAAQFTNVLIVILLIATGLSALLGQGIEAIAILVIVLFAVVLGFIQEFRTERAIEALRKLLAPTAIAIRDGEEIEVPARALVPGDVLILRAGNLACADARLLEAVNLAMNEASLTGESTPVEKETATLAAADLAVGDQRNRVFAGTIAIAGRGRAVVVATGARTEVGRVAGLLKTVERSKTPLQIHLDRIGTVLARVALAVVAAIVVLGVVRGLPLLDMLVFGIALAVAVVPEALPAVVTISLALGVRRLVKRHALIRRLPALETLGGTSVICSDKTGTLTRDEMTVRSIYVDDEMIDVTGAGYEPRGEFVNGQARSDASSTLARLLEAAALASDAHIARDEESGTWQVSGDPTEGALVAAAAKLGLDKIALDAATPRVAEIPFCAENKCMTTLHSRNGGQVAYTKGAPEVVLAACTRQRIGGNAMELDVARRDRIAAAAENMASRALRVLAIATRDDATLENAQRDLTLLGLVGMIDPPRDEAHAAIQRCMDAGIRVVMITGDHPSTARAIASELGVLRGGRVVTGGEVDTMSDAALGAEIEQIDVYARVSPEHKLRVVTALQQRGHVVAMTGDGVNDAPALKKADIGVAMGITGTDVAKEAAAMTLVDDNFASIVAAVEEGRATFGNIKKYLMYLLSSNVGEIFLMAAAALFGLPLPLSAVQILYVNLATDGLPALALAVDPPEHDLMQRPPRDPRVGIFTRPVVVLMLVGGAWSAIVNIGLFVWALDSGAGLSYAMTMTFVSLVLIQFFKAYNFRSDRLSVFIRPFANHWLTLAIAWELTLLLAIVHVPVVRQFFGTTALTFTDWAIVGALALSIVPVLEATKWLVRHGFITDAAHPTDRSVR